MLEFLVNNIVVVFGGHPFFNKASLSPVETNCDPLLAYLFFTPLRQSLCKQLSKTKELQNLKPLIARSGIDDVLSITNPKFANWIQLTLHQRTAHSTSFGDIYLIFDINIQLSSRLYDKRVDLMSLL